ncbi:MAG: DUF817 domain-containing protein [Sphingopyxis sp.]
MTEAPVSTATAHTRFAAIRARLEAYQPRPGWRIWTFEFLLFGFKQGWACLFGALMLALLLATFLYYPENAALARYDAITIGAVIIQIAMLAFKLETIEEARVILVFHVVGTAMELFKTSVGSWIYPEPSLLHIGAVPLFSGFMYASVGSYLARVWRIFDFQFTSFPSRGWLIAIASGIYVNFFTHHWMVDLRWLMFALVLWQFWGCNVAFKPFRTRYAMPLLFGFLLVALFIWFAENIGTYTHAWAYPNQRHGWAPVGIAKLGSWYLLMIISFVLVALLHHKPDPYHSR